MVLVLSVVIVVALALRRGFVRGLVLVFNRGVDSHSHTLTTLLTTDHTASTATVVAVVVVVVVDSLVVGDGVAVDALSIVVIGGTFPSSFLKII